MRSQEKRTVVGASRAVKHGRRVQLQDEFEPTPDLPYPVNSLLRASVAPVDDDDDDASAMASPTVLGFDPVCLQRTYNAPAQFNPPCRPSPTSSQKPSSRPSPALISS